MPRISGPRLFLMYAWPCAEYRKKAGLITDCQYCILEMLVENGDNPPTNFLQRCFPNAVAKIEEYATKNSRQAWSIETVTCFWRNHHGHEGDCAVISAIVCFVAGNGSQIEVIHGNKTFYVSNPYNLSVNVGDEIYIHRKTAVEIL